jgi:hypothetical protein
VHLVGPVTPIYATAFDQLENLYPENQPKSSTTFKTSFVGTYILRTQTTKWKTIISITNNPSSKQ